MEVSVKIGEKPVGKGYTVYYITLPKKFCKLLELRPGQKLLLEPLDDHSGFIARKMPSETAPYKQVATEGAGR